MPGPSFDIWEFIERWLPDYYQNDKVAYSDDLQCYIDGETEHSTYYDIKEEFPDVEDAMIELERVNAELYLEAMETYKAAMSEEREQKRQAALAARPKFKYRIDFTYADCGEIQADDKDEAIEKLRRMVFNMNLRHPEGLDYIGYEIVDVIPTN